METQHQGIGVHEDEWRNGATCDECRARYEENMSKHGSAPNFNIARLKADNAGHYTQHGLAREIYENARASGEEIQRVR